MVTISLKLPSPLLKQLQAEAKRTGRSKSALVRDALENKLGRMRRKPKLTCLDLMSDMIGSFKGPADLSTNPRHLDEAISKDEAGGKKRAR